MPENLSSILDSTEPTLLTTGWGAPKDRCGMPRATSRLWM